jgi:hypothetical protein
MTEIVSKAMGNKMIFFMVGFSEASEFSSGFAPVSIVRKIGVASLGLTDGSGIHQNFCCRGNSGESHAG